MTELEIQLSNYILQDKLFDPSIRQRACEDLFDKVGRMFPKTNEECVFLCEAKVDHAYKWLEEKFPGLKSVASPEEIERVKGREPEDDESGNQGTE